MDCKGPNEDIRNLSGGDRDTQDYDSESVMQACVKSHIRYLPSQSGVYKRL